jgi:hypothetical protein
MKKRVFLAVITACLMSSGCATNSVMQAEKGRYQPKNGLEDLPAQHPLAMICSADILGMVQWRSNMISRSPLDRHSGIEAYGRVVVDNVERLINPALKYPVLRKRRMDV